MKAGTPSLSSCMQYITREKEGFQALLVKVKPCSSISTSMSLWRTQRRFMSMWRQPVNTRFFNRIEELQGLKRMVGEGQAGKMLLVTGPPNSGKSALLREFVDWQLKEKKGFPIYINMRSGTYNTAESFARELKAQAATTYIPAVANVCNSVLSGNVKDVVDASLGNILMSDAIKSLVAIVRDYVRDVESTRETDMLNLIKRLEGLFFNWRSLIRKLGHGLDAGFPTLVIDEANRLDEWSLTPEEQQNLATLQAWFIMITKEMGLANVVLCSSEDFFRVWMNSRLGSGRYQLGVVGDLTKHESLEFFTQQLLESRSHDFASKYELPGELWTDIYDYVGGRMNTLKVVADILSWAVDDKDELRRLWEKLMVSMQSLSEEEMAEGFFPESLPAKWTRPPLGARVTDPLDTVPLWTAEEYAAVLKIMAAAEDGVVSKHALLHDKVIRKTALFSLIQHNFLYFREIGIWGGKDLKWYSGKYPAVMPTSRPCFHAIKKILEENRL